MTAARELPSADEVAALLATHAPALAGLPVEPLGEGADFRAFDVGGRVVVRFPKHDEAAQSLAREARFTTWLARRLPLPIPRQRSFSVEPALVGYEKLPGAPALGVALDRPALLALARELGRCLRALHALDPDEGARQGLPDDDDPTLREWSESAREDVERCRTAGLLEEREAERLSRYFVTRPKRAHVRPRVVHGDLAAEHVLVDERGAPSGIIDWSDAHLGDPARDFAGLFHWGGEDTLRAALAAASVDDETLVERARWLAACRAVADLLFGTERANPTYVQAGQQALTHLAPFVGR